MMTAATAEKYPLATMAIALSVEELAHEEWRDVDGSDGRYQVSDLGRVRCLYDERGGGRTYYDAPRLRRIQVTGKRREYRLVALRLKGRPVSTVVHKLVAAAFLGPRPEGHDVAHKDGKSWNNRKINLAYKTPADNHADKRVHGTLPVGEAHWGAKLTDADIIKIRASNLTQREIGELFGITQCNVWHIKNRRTWTHV